MLGTRLFPVHTCVSLCHIRLCLLLHLRGISFPKQTAGSMPGSIQAPEKMGAEDAPMPLNNLPWGKELMAGVVNVLDEYDIPSLLWGDSVLAALDKPTALDVSPPPSPQKPTQQPPKPRTVLLLRHPRRIPCLRNKRPHTRRPEQLQHPLLKITHLAIPPVHAL